MKTLVVKVNRVTRDNYELKYGYDRSKDEALKHNQYKEDVDYLLNRINNFGYVGVAL